MPGNGLVLQAARGDRAVGSAAVDNGPITIGSWRGATLPLDDENLQPVQVVLDPVSEGRWRLTSLVEGGCRVNGRVVQRTFVTRADRIEVGPYEVAFAGNADEPEKTPPVLMLAPRVGGEQPLRAVLRWRGTPLDARVIAPDELLSIGHGRHVTFELPEGDQRCWAAAACLDGVWHVALDAPARATNADDDRPLLSAAARTDGPDLPRGFVAGKLWAPIPDGAHVRLVAGSLSIELERCHEFSLARVERPPTWATPEGQGFIIALMVAACLVAMIRITPRDADDDQRGLGPSPDVIARVQPQPMTEDVKDQLTRWQKDHAKPDNAGAEKARGIEGQAGRPDASRREARRAGPKSDAEIVRDQAIFKMLTSGTTAQILAGGSLSAANALGHLAGPTVGDAQGVLGLGIRGGGSGGGGLSSDTVGVGPVGTHGVGLGKASGVGKVGRGGQSDLGIDEPASVEGGLDREVIRRVILSHRAQIRYCYEKELSVHPDLTGKVLVEFVIAGDGSVTTAHTKEQTLADTEVGSCIVSRVKGWTFPHPKNNSVVVVTYPFLFKPAGQGAH